jgi:hypothetical protein
MDKHKLQDITYAHLQRLAGYLKTSFFLIIIACIKDTKIIQDNEKSCLGR